MLAPKIFCTIGFDANEGVQLNIYKTENTLSQYN